MHISQFSTTAHVVSTLTRDIYSHASTLKHVQKVFLLFYNKINS